jgi:hypothetical protein
MFLPELLQAATAASPDIGRRAADVLQVLTAGGVTACVAMLWKFGGRLTAIETTLSDPDIGVKPAITSLRKSRHNDGNTLQEHETRLDGHDRDIQRIDNHLIGERRAPNQVEQPFGGRRATT